VQPLTVADAQGVVGHVAHGFTKVGVILLLAGFSAKLNQKRAMTALPPQWPLRLMVVHQAMPTQHRVQCRFGQQPARPVDAYLDPA